MQLIKHYVDVGSMPLDSILSDFKENLSIINILDSDTRYKYEFISEELITNSYKHAKPREASFDITLILSDNPARIVLKETGTHAIDADAILKKVEICKNNIDQLHPGGLGIALIMQLARKFKCLHDKKKSVNLFEAII